MWWTEDGRHLLSSHSDGSYCRWVVGEGDESDEEEKSDIPYGESAAPGAVHSVSVAGRPVKLIAAVPSSSSLQDTFPARPFPRSSSCPHNMGEFWGFVRKCLCLTARERASVCALLECVRVAKRF